MACVNSVEGNNGTRHLSMELMGLTASSLPALVLPSCIIAGIFQAIILLNLWHKNLCRLTQIKKRFSFESEWLWYF